MTEEEEISERRKLLLPKLFRVWNTLIKMMKDRGYSLEERKEKFSLRVLLKTGEILSSNSERYLQLTRSLFFETILLLPRPPVPRRHNLNLYV